MTKKARRLAIAEALADEEAVGRRGRWSPLDGKADRGAKRNGKAREEVRDQRWTRAVKPKSDGQARFMEAIAAHHITIALGPAGTGKTYLAVAAAVDALRSGKVSRIILSRPAIEAGERIGFLPGDMREKLDPYMRPLFDALLDRMDPKQLAQLMEQKVIEIAPVGFMRGRTLAGACIVVDEAQNLTPGQLRMVLTRLGFGSFMVMTGDPEQSDLDEGDSGLATVAAQIEGKLEGVAVVRLAETDVVRHPVVRALIPLLGSRIGI